MEQEFGRLNRLAGVCIWTNAYKPLAFWLPLACSIPADHGSIRVVEGPCYHPFYDETSSESSMVIKSEFVDISVSCDMISDQCRRACLISSSEGVVTSLGPCNITVVSSEDTSSQDTRKWGFRRRLRSHPTRTPECVGKKQPTRNKEIDMVSTCGLFYSLLTTGASEGPWNFTVVSSEEETSRLLVQHTGELSMPKAVAGSSGTEVQSSTSIRYSLERTCHANSDFAY